MLNTQSLDLKLKSNSGKENLKLNITKEIEELILKIESYNDDTFNNSSILTTEVLSSSAIEGYYTTKQNLNNMIEGQPPKNNDQLKIIRNYRALYYGLANLDKVYTKEYLLKINNNLMGADKTKYRDHEVSVGNKQGIVHDGTISYKVDEYMNDLLNFMKNSDLNDYIKSCVSHFYLAYVHPFEDGNGRTTRAYIYLYLISMGHNVFKRFSISYIIKEQKARYYNSFLEVENNDFDVTPFVKWLLGLMLKGLENLDEIDNKVLGLDRIKEMYKKEGLSFNLDEEKLYNYILELGRINTRNYYKKYRSYYIRNGFIEDEIELMINRIVRVAKQLKIINEECVLILE